MQQSGQLVRVLSSREIISDVCLRRLINEANAVFGPGRIGCLVSLGTGLPPKVALGHPTLCGLLKFTGSLVAIATGGEDVHTSLAKRPKDRIVSGDKWYWRFNLGERLLATEADGVTMGNEVIFGPAKIGKLDDWRGMGDLVKMTAKYVGEAKNDIEECAVQLKSLKP